MAISFNETANQKRPAIRVEYDASSAVAGPQEQPYKCLMTGQMLAAGSATALTPYIVNSADQAATLFGKGSMLHNMAQTYFKNPAVTDLTVVAFSDPSGSKSAGSLDFAGTATAAGTVHLYIAGKKVTAAVSSSNTATQVAAAVVAAINAKTDLPVTAAVNGGDDTIADITYRHNGTIGDQVDIRLNYAAGEELPAGITATVNAMSSGAGVPDYTTLWSVIGDVHYNIWIVPHTDSTSLGAVKTELDSRATSSRQIEAIAFCGNRDTVGDATTLGNSHNSEFVSITNVKACPNPDYEIAASVAKEVMVAGAIDPARPFQTLKLWGIAAPKVSDRLIGSERETLLNNGIATVSVSDDGTVRIERLITTYETNDQGGEDTSYLDVNTLLTLSYIRYDVRNTLATKYPRHKLANDSARIGAGQAVLTPSTAKGEMISKFIEWETRVIVEDIDQFKKDLIVERNAADPNRLDILLPTNLANQLRNIGVKLGFIV